MGQYPISSFQKYLSPSSNRSPLKVRIAKGKRGTEVSPKIKQEELDMKFTNTKSQVKEVGTSAVEWGKATVKLAKAVVKVPVAVGKDVSSSAKTYAENRSAYKEWLKSREQPQD